VPKRSHHGAQTLFVELERRHGETSEAWDDLLPDAAPWARRILGETLAGAGAEDRIAEGCVLSLLFADDAAIRDLNRRFRGKDKPTNVLSFPAGPLPQGEEAPLLGDVAFALQTVRAEAAASGKPFSHHMTHLLVHGILHLLGFTHEDDAEEGRMTAIEIAVLDALGIPDPYRAPDMQMGAA
jgi:probable rRNA maturation factor